MKEVCAMLFEKDEDEGVVFDRNLMLSLANFYARALVYCSD